MTFTSESHFTTTGWLTLPDRWDGDLYFRVSLHCHRMADPPGRWNGDLYFRVSLHCLRMAGDM